MMNTSYGNIIRDKSHIYISFTSDSGGHQNPLLRVITDRKYTFPHFNELKINFLDNSDMKDQSELK
jgi:hypothetical protein